MAMDPRDFELIALGHILSKYRISGELPSINGQPFSLNEFKSKLFADVPNYDTDININIDTVKMENTVVDCDQSHDESQTATAVANVDQSKVESTTITESNASPTSSEKSTIGGKLFQFFNKDPEK